MSQILSPLSETEAVGELLAKSPRWAPLLDGLEGWERQCTAILLENQRQFFKMCGRDPDRYLTETTLTPAIGAFDKLAFPIIRAMAPSLIAQEICSVQPMAMPVGLVFYMDLVFSNTKGNITAGTSALDALTGVANTSEYSAPVVPNLALGLSGNNTVATTLSPAPIVPGTVILTCVDDQSPAVTRVYRDDANGTFIQISGAADANAATIDYTTGQLSAVNLTANIASATVSFQYYAEANDNVQGLDMQIVSSPIKAEVRKLRTRISMEAMQQLQSLHGLNGQSELANAMQQYIGREIDRTIINDMWTYAAAGTVTWDKALPNGVAWEFHKRSLVDAFINGSVLVHKATKRVEPNFVVCGLDVSAVIRSLGADYFKPAAGALETSRSTGPRKLGTVAGTWEVYQDPDLPTAEWVMGYKSSNFLDAAYVYAPYVPLYMTDPITLDDFMLRQGAATQFGRKIINGRMLSRGKIVNTGQ